jgi:diaminohydroxyphosphoribosylaminopyrimidine deaminase/5-amino-6-(5-phosphoribosylamino)uracil reductase
MDDRLWMLRCLELAARGIGAAAPNPMVGAVLVHNGRLIGEGWHTAWGMPHAEVACLNNVAPCDRPLIPESTLYVNLEPCAHFGKTPPCANRIVQEQIKKVVICNRDPFEKVSGRGIELLLDAGIEVIIGIMEAEGRWLNRRFFHFHEQHRPYIILKWAESVDGFIAPANRSRRQISGPQSQLQLHKWRTEEQAIMVGTTTAINDDPALTARKWQGRQPIRIVADRNLSVPATHQLFNKDAATVVFNLHRDEVADNVRYRKIEDMRNLPNLLQELTALNLLSVLVEGGAALLNSFIIAGLWNEARIFTGPQALGSGISAPVLQNAAIKEQYYAGADRLQIFTNSLA